MLVRFLSSETGEILMFAEAARTLLQAIGKECSARGTFTQAEMADAARTLREAVQRAEAPPVEDEVDEYGKKKEPVVALGQRAWPLIDMLKEQAGVVRRPISFGRRRRIFEAPTRC